MAGTQKCVQLEALPSSLAFGQAHKAHLKSSAAFSDPSLGPRDLASLTHSCKQPVRQGGWVFLLEDVRIAA